MAYNQYSQWQWSLRRSPLVHWAIVPEWSPLDSSYCWMPIEINSRVSELKINASNLIFKICSSQKFHTLHTQYHTIVVRMFSESMPSSWAPDSPRGLVVWGSLEVIQWLGNSQQRWEQLHTLHTRGGGGDMMDMGGEWVTRLTWAGFFLTRYFLSSSVHTLCIGVVQFEL